MPSFFFVNHPNTLNTFIAIVKYDFNAFELVANFEKEESCTSSTSRNRISLKTYENVREEMALYLQVYNNASPDKFELKPFYEEEVAPLHQTHWQWDNGDTPVHQ